MKQLDDTLREALAHDPDLSETDLHEPGLIELFTATFRSSIRWWAVLVMIYIFAFAVIAVIVAFQFFAAETVKHQILWATVFTYSGIAIAMLKMWWWNQMDRLALTREIKRLELRLMLLSKRADTSDDAS